METVVQYFGQPMRVACDEKCHKAWGVNNRPKQQLSGDDDDYFFYGDDELGDAPVNPGTYEGGQGKPVGDDNKPIQDIIPNKWCVRECERCESSRPGKSHEPLELTDWTNRFYNLTASEPK